ncbi:cleft lip and palate transmembrane protein 1-domain-containing protein [Helicostylum pulchrum]|nr:cleft lip and palate transmembrane protein 1-domain-containing protein [Helicostylum pulchrum]
MRLTLLIQVFAFLIQLSEFSCQQQNVPNIPHSFHNMALVPLWKKNTWMTLSIYINSDNLFSDYKAEPNWKFQLQNNDSPILTNAVVDITHKNVAIYAHIFLVKDSFPIDPANSSFSIDSIVYVCHGLTKFYQNKPYWHNTITISLVHHPKDYISKDTLHPATLKHFLNNQGRQRVGFYRPIVFPNDFWLIQKDAYPINHTTGILPLTVQLETINLWKFNVYAVLADEKKPSPSYSIDETKQFMSNMNPSYTLSFTLITCLLHGLFELLAVKNDVSFWIDKTNSIGVSTSSIILNLSIQIILFDLKSTLTCTIQLIRICIEIWKLYRLFKFKYYWILIQHPKKTRFVIRTIPIQHPTLIKRGENTTNMLDCTALQYIACIVTPLFLLFELWSTTTTTTTTISINLAHFLIIIPQLYINHQMHMVNNVSIDTMVYKSINIAIDGLFALAIGIPILHQLSFIKSNLIFLVYIFQKYYIQIRKK